MSADGLSDIPTSGAFEKIRVTDRFFKGNIAVHNESFIMPSQHGALQAQQPGTTRHDRDKVTLEPFYESQHSYRRIPSNCRITHVNLEFTGNRVEEMLSGHDHNDRFFVIVTQTPELFSDQVEILHTLQMTYVAARTDPATGAVVQHAYMRPESTYIEHALHDGRAPRYDGNRSYRYEVHGSGMYDTVVNEQPVFQADMPQYRQTGGYVGLLYKSATLREFPDGVRVKVTLTYEMLRAKDSVFEQHPVTQRRA